MRDAEAWTNKKSDRVEHILKFMEWNAISDRQHQLVISFEDQFRRRGVLSERQLEILEDIFRRAAEDI